MYDEAGHLLGEYDNGGAPVQQILWLDDLPVGVLAGSGAGQKLHYIEPDHLGTPRVIIDGARNVAIWKWDLQGEAFGASPPNQNPDGDATQFVFNLRYPGQRYDSAAGMNYNYFRDYDPSTGRYVESHPIGLMAGPSTYGYALGSPTNSTDRLGLDIDGDYFKCLFERAVNNAPYSCGQLLIQTAVAGTKKAFVENCKAVTSPVEQIQPLCR